MDKINKFSSLLQIGCSSFVPWTSYMILTFVQMWQYSLIKLTGVGNLKSAIPLLRVLGMFYLGWTMAVVDIKGFGGGTGFHWLVPNIIQNILPLEQLCKPL